MLDLDRGRALDPQDERARLRCAAAGGPRPLDPFRLRIGGNLGPGDLDPAGDERGRGEALPGERLVEGSVHKICQRPRVRFARLVHG